LKEKSPTCEYGGLKDELIRDKIVLGFANEDARRRLLREEGLTLLTVIEMCRTTEVTDMRMRAMEIKTPRSGIDTVHAVARNTSRQNQSRQSNSP
jgi:hypothetical protein